MSGATAFSFGAARLVPLTALHSRIETLYNLNISVPPCCANSAANASSLPVYLVADSVPITTHYHHATWIVVFFFVGAGLHILLQTSSIADAHKKTLGEAFEILWIRIAFRSFFTLLAFIALWQYPQIVAMIPSLIGHPLGPDETQVFEIPMNIVIAGMAGLFLDSLFGYIPKLKSALPAIDIASESVGVKS